MSINKGTQ